MNVIIDSDTGQSAEITEWVARFGELWKGGKSNVSEFMKLLNHEVRLIAPGLRSTKGREAGVVAFEKTFDVFPDLVGEVINWGANGNVLFIEMTFMATVGGKKLKWYNVDRFVFQNGSAIERVAFFDPSKLQRAFLCSPAGWIHLIRRIRSGL